MGICSKQDVLNGPVLVCTLKRMCGACFHLVLVLCFIFMALLFHAFSNPATQYFVCLQHSTLQGGEETKCL